MPTRLPAVPLGRLSDLHARPDADRIAYTVRGFDALPTVFSSRAAMLPFCKDGSAMHALRKAPVHQTMLINRNTQRPEA